jgi:hypothetical protein
MKVVLTSEVELLASARPVPDPAHRATGGAPWNDLLSRSGEFVVSYPLERSGSIRAVGLRPGAPFTVRLKDTLDAVLHEGVWTLGEGEERLVEIPLAAPPRRLEVRVTDLEGRPLEDVSVEIGSGEPLPRGRPGEPIRIFERLRSVARSDAAGLFRFEGLYADVVDLSVSKPGFVSWRDRALRVPADRAPVVVRLEPGQTVQLRIHDQAGRPVLRARIPEVGGAAARLVEDGNFRWVDLPRGTTTLRVIVAGRTYELAHDTAVPEARLVVPVHGALRVRWEVLPDQTGPLHVQLTPTGSDGAALTEVVHPAPGRPEGDVLLPLVLPGEYHVELRRSPGMREASAPVSAAGTVRVAPDATAEVVLTR